MWEVLNISELNTFGLGYVFCDRENCVLVSYLINKSAVPEKRNDVLMTTFAKTMLTGSLRKISLFPIF